MSINNEGIPAEVLAQWDTMIRVEKAGNAIVRRDLNSYLSKLGGLAHFLDYVESRCPVAVDIGAGHAVAVNQMAEDTDRNLKYLATGMVRPVDYNSARVPYLETGAEVLQGIDDDSVGGVLAVHSIIFSAAPDMVVDAIDRVLVDGGVVKTNLVINQGGDYVPRSQGVLQSELVAKDYDVALDESGKVLLALKPGGYRVIGARALLRADLEGVSR